MSGLQFEYVPWKRVIVHEVVFEPIDKILSYYRASVPMGGVGDPMRWCDGWLFTVNGAPLTPDTVRERKEGVIRWTSLGLSPCPVYVQKLEIVEGKIAIPVLNVSHLPLFKEMISWMKMTFPEKVKEAEEWVKSPRIQGL